MTMTAANLDAVETKPRQGRIPVTPTHKKGQVSLPFSLPPFVFYQRRIRNRKGNIVSARIFL